MGLDRLGGDEQLSGDLTPGQVETYQRRHLLLAWSERPPALPVAPCSAPLPDGLIEQTDDDLILRALLTLCQLTYRLSQLLVQPRVS